MKYRPKSFALWEFIPADALTLKYFFKPVGLLSRFGGAS